MGGFGSGRYRSSHDGRTVNDFARVDVREVARHHCLVPGDAIFIAKRRIELDWTPTHFGRPRVWFRCPGCRARVALLYAAADGLLCRKCRGLTYPTQYQDARDRAFTRAAKIRRRFGAGPGLAEPIPWPRGMRWTTQRRWSRRYQLAVYEALGLTKAEALRRIRRSEQRVLRDFCRVPSLD